MAPDKDVCVLVTVGSTQFDALVSCMTDAPALSRLARAGATSLTVQHGAGAAPRRVGESAAAARLAVAWFAFAPSLAPHVARAHVVVSHAGAGCVFEALAARAHVVAVPNRALMDDHQAEIADALAARGALRVADAGEDAVAAAVAACRDAVDGVAPPGDEAVPRNPNAIVSIVAEEAAQRLGGRLHAE